MEELGNPIQVSGIYLAAHTKRYLFGEFPISEVHMSSKTAATVFLSNLGMLVPTAECFIGQKALNLNFYSNYIVNLQKVLFLV